MLENIQMQQEKTKTEKLYHYLKSLQNDFGPITVNLIEISRVMHIHQIGLRKMLNSLKSKGLIKAQQVGKLTIIDFV